MVNEWCKREPRNTVAISKPEVSNALRSARPPAALADAHQVQRRDQQHEQNGPIPEHRKNPQRLLECRLPQALRQRSIANQLPHWTTQLDRQISKDGARDQPREYRETTGDIGAEREPDLRGVHPVTQRGKEPHREQRTHAVLTNNLHGGPFVSGIEHRDQ